MGAIYTQICVPSGHRSGCALSAGWGPHWSQACPLWAQVEISSRCGAGVPYGHRFWVHFSHKYGSYLGIALGSCWVCPGALFGHVSESVQGTDLGSVSTRLEVPHGARMEPIPSCMLAPSWPWAVLHGPAALLGLTVLLPLPSASSPPPAPLTPLQPQSSPAPHMSVRHFYVTPENLGAHLRHSSAVAPNLFPQILLPTPKVVFS